MKDFILKYWIEVLFGAVIAALSVAYKKLSSKRKKELQEQENMREGVKALLRSSIVQIYNDCTIKEHCPIYLLENAEALYVAYHKLGGNGTATQLMKELREMKHSPGDDSEK